MIPRKKICCKNTKNEWSSYHNKIVWLSFVLMQDSWPLLMSDNTSWQKTLNNSHNLQIQWLVVSTLSQEMKKSSDPKGWIRGSTKIGPALEVTTSYLQGKYGVEIRIESVNKDNSHSWVRISHGLNGHGIERQQGARPQRAGNLRDAVRQFCAEIECTCFCKPTKGQSTTTRRTDVESEDVSPVAYPVSKLLSTLLCHGHLLREDDGAIEFWRTKEYLRNDLERSQHWSDEVWQSEMVGGGGNKKRFQNCTDPPGQEFLYLRALQSHAARNFIDPSLQNNVLIPNDFFDYIYYIGCAINLHSITNSGLILGG